MQRTTLWFAALVLLLLIPSCNQTSTSPSTPTKETLSVSENPINIARNNYKYISVTGGKGNYSVKSVSDSAIVQVTIPQNYDPRYVQSISLFGKNLGAVTIVIQDSAKTAEVSISVLVTTIASSPSSVKVEVGQIAYIYFSGGTSPYAVDVNSNFAIATVSFNFNSMEVTGVAEGTTSVVIRDNATPQNKVTIPITVIPRPRFTTAGQISFTSSKGNFSANGIAMDDIISVPPDGEGAGEWMATSINGNIGIIQGYKKKSATIVDIIAVYYLKKDFTPASLPIDSLIFKMDSAFVVFALNGDLTSQSADLYVLTSGIVTFKDLSTQHASGSFSGIGVMKRDDLIYPSNTVSVTEGLFDVPVLLDNPVSVSSVNKEDKRIKLFMDKIFQKEFQKWKLLKEQ